MKALVTTILLGFASFVFAGEGWPTDFEAAKKEAAEKGLPILADFSGSDWCKWCVRLDDEVFSQPEFKAYAKDHLILFLADFPSRTPQSDELKAQNEKLSAKYNVKGFPTVLLLNADGSVIARMGYASGGAEAYIELINKEVK